MHYYSEPAPGWTLILVPINYVLVVAMVTESHIWMILMVFKNKNILHKPIFHNYITWQLFNGIWAYEYTNKMFLVHRAWKAKLNTDTLQNYGKPIQTKISGKQILEGVDFSGLTHHGGQFLQDSMLFATRKTQIWV